MAFVPTTGQITMTNIRNARNSDGSAGTTSNTFSVLRDNAIFSKFDPAYLAGATNLSQVTKFSQWRNYPNSAFIINSINLICYDIDNNQTTVSPIQLIVGTWDVNGEIYRSTNFGNNYSRVLNIVNILNGVKFMPAFRHASYLSVVPFLSVGNNGRIVTNSVTDCSSWITISSPTTQNLNSIAFNSSGVGIIVGDARIIKTNTNNRINSWSIVNSVNFVWRSVSSDGTRFVAVGGGSAILAGDSLGTTWTTGNMPPLAPPNITLYSVTYHTDSFFYAIGLTALNSPYIMRSSDSGFNWSVFNVTGTFAGNSIESINGKLYLTALEVIYEIDNGVSRAFSAPGALWYCSVKDPNSTGVDIGGFGDYGNS
jgi:hypothetical protein